jgi:hypothetical protein
MANSIIYKALGGLSSNQYQTYCVEISVDTYATGGVAIPFKGFDPTMVIGVEAVDGAVTYTPAFDLATKKLKLFSGSTEVSEGSITASKFHLTFFGYIL